MASEFRIILADLSSLARQAFRILKSGFGLGSS